MLRERPIRPTNPRLAAQTAKAPSIIMGRFDPTPKPPSSIPYQLRPSSRNPLTSQRPQQWQHGQLQGPILQLISSPNPSKPPSRSPAPMSSNSSPGTTSPNPTISASSRPRTSSTHAYAQPGQPSATTSTVKDRAAWRVMANYYTDWYKNLT